ncbi:MAG: double-strand break repair helicase AddA [Rhodospirillaceae bacterium]
MVLAGLDPNVRQRLASDPAASVWVAASAGSGKTKVLTDRVLRQMLAGTPPARILCLTFTKAAAAEMANRINRTLGLWATVSDDELEQRLCDLTGERPNPATRCEARRLFARVIDCPGGMKLQTIHAFCQSLLRRFPLEAGLAPHFEVMDEATASELLNRARSEILSASRLAPEAPLGRALVRLTADLQEEGLGALMAELAKERSRIRIILDRHGGLEATVAEVHRLLGVASGADEETITKAACADSAFAYDDLRRVCPVLGRGSPTDQERAATVAAWLAAGIDERATGFTPYLRCFLTEKDLPRKSLITKKAAAAAAEAPEILAAEADRLVLVLEKRRAASVATATAALLTFGGGMLEAYARQKDARALLDYDDLILSTRDLLARDGVAPWVLFKLDGGLDHILIDEAQDTNPEQWQVVARLAEEFFAGLGARSAETSRYGNHGTGENEGLVRTVFAVGDEKQSIFSFQRANPQEFVRLRRHFQDKVENASRLWRQVRLDISFRSTAAVLNAVDLVFARDEARNGVALEPDAVIRHFAHRRGQGGLVELWPPVSPAERQEPAPWQPPLVREPMEQPEARLAATIADTIRGWLDCGEVLESRGRPVRPGDIMVLVRRRTGFVAELVRALKERDVPVAGVDRMVLTGQLSVMDLTALADFLLLRDDDLTLAVVLKGPFIGLDEEQLYALAFQRPGNLWQALGARAAAESDSLYARARLWLNGLLSVADFTPPYEFFASVLHQPCPANRVSGLSAVLGRLGVEARDPLDEFLSICLTFQRIHPPSLQVFLHWLAASGAEIKREQESGGGSVGGLVRIMTVHGAKGLQSPIVFLPDTMGKPVQSARILWPDDIKTNNVSPGDQRTVPLYAPRRAQEGAVCVAARNAADQRRDQEYRRLLYVALTRAEDRLYICGWRGKNDSAPDSWYGLIAAALANDDSTTAFPFCGGWGGEGRRLFDPQTAPTDAPRIAPTAPELMRLPVWARTVAPDEPEPSRPLSPSRPDDDEPAVSSPIGSDGGSRFQRGLLLHRLFQTLPELEPAVRATAASRYLARPVHGLPAVIQSEMVLEALAVLNHPEFAPLFGPGSRAEVPLVGIIGDRTLSGRIDRLLVTDREVWIVDYKTNRPPPRDVAAVTPLYLRQMAGYREAVRSIYPGHDVRCLLLWTDAPKLMALPDALLARCAADLASNHEDDGATPQV